MEDSSSLNTSLDNIPTLFPANRLKSKTEAVRPSATLRFQRLSNEEIKETLEKAKEYLRMNKNISTFYVLNRVVKLIDDSEIDIHVRFQIYRGYCEAIKRLISRIFVKHPEKNDKNTNKIHSLLLKAFAILDEWNRLCVFYVVEFANSLKNRNNHKILQEIQEKTQPLLKSEREKLFTIKEEVKSIEKPPDLKTSAKNSEETTNKNANKQLKFRKLQGEERENAIKCGFFTFFLFLLSVVEFYLEKFIEYYVEFSFLLAFLAKKKKTPALAAKILTNISETLRFSVIKLKNEKFLDVFARSQLLLSSIYCENGNMSEVLTLNSELLEIFRVYFVCVAEKEFDFREKGLLAKHRKKLRKCVRLMSLSFVFHSIYLEAAEKYEKSLETLKFVSWLCSAFLEAKDEVLLLMSGLLAENLKKYNAILREKGEIANILQLYFSKIEKSSVFLNENEPKESLQADLLQESDAHLYEKFKKQADSVSFFCVKPNISSISASNFADLEATMLNNNKSPTKSPNKSVVIQENADKNCDKAQETQEKLRLFEVSLEPSFKEQSLTAKRLSVMGKKLIKTSGNLEKTDKTENSWAFLKEPAQEREKARSFYSDRNNNNNNNKANSMKSLRKSRKDSGDFPTKSSILTTMKYFKTSEEIRKIIEAKHKKPGNSSESERSAAQIMQNLDDFFAKKINEILLKKCQNRSMKEIQETFVDLQKDEDFDKKEFDFSKKMLRHKKSYSMGRIKAEYLTSNEDRERLHFLHPRREVRGEIREISTKHNILSRMEEKKFAQEDEKTANFSLKLCERSSITAENTQNLLLSQKLLQSSNETAGKTGKEMISSKEKLQNIVMKHRVTFEFKKMLDVQRKISLARKTGTPLRDISWRKSRSGSIIKRRIPDESKETIEKYHKNTKEMIQKMAETLVKDIENADKMLKESLFAKENEGGDTNISRKNKEIRAKQLKLVKINGDLSKSMKNLAMKKEMLENFQTQINLRMNRKPSNLGTLLTLNKLQSNLLA